MRLYLNGVQLHENQPEWTDAYPFHLPWLRDFKLTFTAPVTFFVGENGSGKSTLMEALASLVGLPAAGGGRADLGAHYTPKDAPALAPLLRPISRQRARDAYFFRAEHQANYAALLQSRAR